MSYGVLYKHWIVVVIESAVIVNYDYCCADFWVKETYKQALHILLIC